MTIADGAKNIIFTSLNVKKGEKVLVLVDSDKKRIGDALFQAALDAGGEATMVTMLPTTRHGEEPPDHVARLMRNFDVIVIATKYSMSHTKARKKANRAGARIITMPGVIEPIISEGSMIADFNDIYKNIRRLYKTIKGKKDIKITTALGTRLTMNIKGRDWITDDTGICHTKGYFTTLPAGEIFIAPKEGTANGKLMIDGSFGGLVEEPVKVIIKNGYAVNIEGAEDIARELDKRGKEGRNVAEFGIGMNPTAKIIGNVLEDEKVLGTTHVAFGDNSTFGGKVECGVHIDAIIKEPTVRMNGKLILEKGVLKI